MGFYPVFLDLTDRLCLVIGGGAVAERKVEGLLRAGGVVTVISPALTERLNVWVKEGKVRHVTRRYRMGDLTGYRIAFAATSNVEVNRAVYAEGRRTGVWVNAADDPSNCDFILPSVLRRGELVVAVSTGGKSPALAKAIREELEAYFPEGYADLAAIISEVRQELQKLSLRVSGDTWRKAINRDLLRLVEEGKRREAKDYLLVQLGAGICG